MPIYEYQCHGCGQTFELIQKLSDPAPATHEACGSDKVQRIMSSTAFVFKGEGWYITDYSRKDKAKKNGGSSEGGSSSGGGNDAA